MEKNHVDLDQKEQIILEKHLIWEKKMMLDVMLLEEKLQKQMEKYSINHQIFKDLLLTNV